MAPKLPKPLSDGNKYNVNKQWVNEKKGLKKELINLRFSSIMKATDLSKCCVTISEVVGLQDCESEYLRETDTNEYWIKLGSGITPVDCYVELFLKEMLIGETSRCYIQTKSGGNISFKMKLNRIEFGSYLFQLPFKEIVSLARHYKENGVKMFKKYPLFAHEYFNKAAKCLISLLPFDTLCERVPDVGDELKPEVLQPLLENVYMNIAACLIKEKRYEDALHVLEFTDRPDNVPDKAIYRRAQAHFYSNQLDEAKTVLERINYKESKDCLALYTNVFEKWKVSNEKYTKMVKKMFE